MYEIKKTSKNGYKLFNSAHARQNQTNLDFLKKISEALRNEQFELYYQPKVDCRQFKVVGAEALVRWNHPILGLLSPSEFIPLIERDALIIALGEWTIQEALRQMQAWREAGISIQISVNISARQLHNQEFPQRLQALLAGHDSEIIKQLEIEIVETAALDDVIIGGDAIRKCRAMGVRVALDDFGTGFSSLTHLKHLAADTLKIDSSFVSGMLTNAGDMAIVEGVIGLAASFRLQVIAEGVEYVEQILILMELGCDVMQGYELARPMPAKQIPAWLAAFAPDPLWSLSASQLTSRDYFALLLAEVNHRQWTNQVITNLGDTRDQITPESLLDHSLCRFGQWCCDKGTSHFHTMSEFHSLDAIHQNIHQTAANLLEHYQIGRQVEADADRAKLLNLQHNMTSLLRHLRSMLADDLLK
jgi:EAL domain-containing protein (putative c-di-GMP-specific phosphodiesterase class I)